MYLQKIIRKSYNFYFGKYYFCHEHSIRSLNGGILLKRMFNDVQVQILIY